MTSANATLKNLDTGTVINCLFNPTEYTIAKTNNWKPKNVIGRNVPVLDFTGGGSRTLELELFFDVYEQKGEDVRKYIDELWKLTAIEEKTKNNETQRARPPLCIFQWGGVWSFKAVITSLSVRYTLFRLDGTPVRAVASVTFQEAADEKDYPGTNPTSHSIQPGRKRREVRPHDTLALIAYEEYGDAAQWRKIAEENAIDDPFDIKPGQFLAIPPLG